MIDGMFREYDHETFGKCSLAAGILGGSAISGLGSLFGGYEQSQAEQKAASTILSGEQQGISAETGYVNQGTSAIQQLLAPYLGIAKGGGGGGVLSTLTNLLTGGGKGGAAGISQLLSNVPGLSWLQGQGQLGVSAQAGQRGLGGNALQGGATVANNIGLASGFQPVVQGLQNLLSTGANASAAGASGIGSLLGGAGQQISNLIGSASGNIAQTQVGQGNAIAGAATGAAGALGGGLSTAGILSALTGGTGGGLFSGSGGGTLGDRAQDYIQDFND